MLCDKTDFISFILRKAEVSHRKKTHKTKQDQKTNKYEKINKQNEIEQVMSCLMLSWKILSDIILPLK